MKVLATIENKVVKFIIEDETPIIINEIKTIIGSPYNEDVWDCNQSNIEVIENTIAAPEDWIGNKYCYDETTEEKWVLNPDYVAPMTEEEFAAKLAAEEAVEPAPE